MTCDNHPDRTAEGIDGNESPLCLPCLVRNHEHARQHVAEDSGTWTEYHAEAAERLAAAQPPCAECERSNGPWYRGTCEH